MTTNVVKLSAPLSEEKSSSFAQVLLSMVAIFRRVFLPHLLVGLGLFLLSSYVTSQILLSPFPTTVQSTLAWLCIFSYGILAFGYSLTAAGVYALRLACVTWDDFISDTIDRVQEKMISHLDKFQDSIAKDQAKVLVRGSVREVYQSTRRSSTLPKWLLTLTLGTMMLVVRFVLTARVIKLAGTTIKFSKIFAGKSTLVGAVFLNLRLFATLLLGLVYMAGGMMLLLNIVFVLSH